MAAILGQSMIFTQRRMGGALSKAAKTRLARARPYPTLDTWRNPVTRPIARRIAKDTFEKSLKQIDFDYRLDEVHRGEIACVRYETRSTRPQHPLILFIHGGGFLSGSPASNAASVVPLCDVTGFEAIGVQYALAPDARFPVALGEIDQVYRALISERAPRPVYLYAESTGAALALASLLRWRDDGLALPAAAILVSPSIDGTGKSDSYCALDGRDPMIRTLGGKAVRELFRYYAPGKDLMDPMVSPIHGDLSGLPPMLIHAGAREVFLGDAARLAAKARQAGVDAHLHVYDGMFHMFHMHWSLDETKAAFKDMARFVSRIEDDRRQTEDGNELPAADAHFPSDDHPRDIVSEPPLAIDLGHDADVEDSADPAQNTLYSAH